MSDKRQLGYDDVVRDEYWNCDRNVRDLNVGVLLDIDIKDIPEGALFIRVVPKKD